MQCSYIQAIHYALSDSSNLAIAMCAFQRHFARQLCMKADKSRMRNGGGGAEAAVQPHAGGRAGAAPAGDNIAGAAVHGAAGPGSGGRHPHPLSGASHIAASVTDQFATTTRCMVTGRRAYMIKWQFFAATYHRMPRSPSSIAKLAVPICTLGGKAAYPQLVDHRMVVFLIKCKSWPPLRAFCSFLYSGPMAAGLNKTD
eukprot:scaffold25135_cov16-Prasinocladus_malaysianus.AAC.1